jgi:ribosomal protein S18 acetylase RimI-like enzyme
MSYDAGDLLRAFGASTRLWVGAGRHEVDNEWWVALSGARNVNFNVACCWSPREDDLARQCLQPLLDLGVPGIAMLAGPGLASAQTLVDSGWVAVGATPLMLLTAERPERDVDVAVRPLESSQLPAARSILAESFRMDETSTLVALPDSVIERRDERAWGLFEEDLLVAVVVIVDVDGHVVVWSMATPPERQGSGLGRRLLRAVLREEFNRGADASLLSSSKAGERLYRDLGYEVVDYLQLWSRPRWILGAS